MYSKIREKMEELYPKFYRYKCDVVDSFMFDEKYIIDSGSTSINSEKLFAEYLRMITRFSAEYVSSYCFAEAADKLAKELDDDGLKLLWQKDYRDREMRYLIPKFFYFVEYLSMMFYELLDSSLINTGSVKFTKNPKTVSYINLIKKIDELLVRKKNLSIYDVGHIQSIKRIMEELLVNFSEKENNIIENFRHIITHRYMPGIDEILMFINREDFRKLVKNDRVLYSIKNEEETTYEFIGAPEFSYIELSTIAKKMIEIMNRTIDEIFKLELSKNIVIKLDEV